MDFEIRENDRGEFELYNTTVGDIYFSNVGAYKEAYEKFVLPSIPVIKNKKELKILDVCYGLGYNSKTFADYVLKNNLNINYDITAVDIDVNIIMLGLFIFDSNISDKINLSFGNEIIKSLNLENIQLNFSGEKGIKYFLPQILSKFKINFDKNDIDLYQKNKITTYLHNIYYQNQLKIKNLISFELKIQKIEDFLLLDTHIYDLIFHDAFSILKQPELWNDFIMLSYFKLLNRGGRLLTYSNSRVLRKRLEQIGFEVLINFDENGKQNGTIAIKN